MRLCAYIDVAPDMQRSSERHALRPVANAGEGRRVNCHGKS